MNGIRISMKIIFFSEKFFYCIFKALKHKLIGWLLNLNWSWNSCEFFVSSWLNTLVKWTCVCLEVTLPQVFCLREERTFGTCSNWWNYKSLNKTFRFATRLTWHTFSAIAPASHFALYHSSINTHLFIFCPYVFWNLPLLEWNYLFSLKCSHFIFLFKNVKKWIFSSKLFIPIPHCLKILTNARKSRPRLTGKICYALEN